MSTRHPITLTTTPAPDTALTADVRSSATFPLNGLPPLPDHRSESENALFLPTVLSVDWTRRANGEVPEPWALLMEGPTLKADGTPSRRTRGSHSFTLTREAFNYTTRKTVPPLWVLDLLDTLGIPTDEARTMHAEAAPTPSDTDPSRSADYASDDDEDEG